MDVGAVPPQAPIGGARERVLVSAQCASDGELVARIRGGSATAFEALDARYRAAILRYCRRLLSDPDEAEDAVQHTFLAAYTSILASHEDIDVRPWLYVIARNRCYSILRARREVAVAELDPGMSEEPGALVERREDLRDLVLDVSRLPEDQRAALIMAELGARSHDEIAGVLEVPRAKVKALVFQARESLMATRSARDTDCADIRRQLRTRRGAALRGGTLRRHLHECAGCREYRRQLRHQRTQFAAVLPLAPLLALRTLLMRTAAAGRSAPVTGGAGSAPVAIKLGALKPLAGALAAMLSAASAVVAVHSMVPHAATHRVAPAVHRAATATGSHHAGPRSSVATHHKKARVTVADRALRHAALARRPRALRARNRLLRRGDWIRSRVMRRLAARHSAASRRVVALRSRARARRRGSEPTVGGPPVSVPNLPPVAPGGPQLPVMTPPIVVHDHDLPPTHPIPSTGDPGQGGGPGEPGPNGPGGPGQDGPGAPGSGGPPLGQTPPPALHPPANPHPSPPAPPHSANPVPIAPSHVVVTKPNSARPAPTPKPAMATHHAPVHS